MAKSFYQVQPNLFFMPEEVKAAKLRTVLGDDIKKQKDGSYIIHNTGSAPLPDQVYLETRRDWVEPITPTTEDVSDISLIETQIRQPHGDVQIAMPSDLNAFSPVTDKMVVPDGAVIKTGDGGSVGIFFGRVASARLIPDTQVGISDVGKGDPQKDGNIAVIVDLKAGGIFGKLSGTNDTSYAVKTPQGAIGTLIGAKGGPDFAVYTTGDHTDVYIIRGSLTVADGTGTAPSTLSASKLNTGTDVTVLKLVSKHIPAITDPAEALAATSQSLGGLISALPGINLEYDALRVHSKLTSKEKNYLTYVKKVTVYERMDRMVPMTELTVPSPTPTPGPQPVAPTPTPNADGQ